MTDELEWGPWIEHDDNGIPVHPATIVIVDLSGDILSPMRADEIGWCFPGDPVTRYRIRKPRGLTILEGLLENLPEMEGAE